MFITIEGIDGCGKSTQSEKLAQWLSERTGRKTIRTFEPGGWPEGVKLREFILTSKNYSAMSELLLFLADRAEHVEKVIAPAIRAGQNVICERWNESTIAYQSGGHKLNVESVNSLITACKFPEPDAKILLDVSPEIAVSRITSRTKSDKFEDEGLVLMQNAAKAYRELAESRRLTRIDCGTLNQEQVFSAIVYELERHLV